MTSPQISHIQTSEGKKHTVNEIMRLIRRIYAFKLISLANEEFWMSFKPKSIWRIYPLPQTLILEPPLEPDSGPRLWGWSRYSDFSTNHSTLSKGYILSDYKKLLQAGTSHRFWKFGEGATLSEILTNK